MKEHIRITHILVLSLITLCVQAQSYRNADLPDALTFLDGTKVQTIADWQKRKAEIKSLWCRTIIGEFPDVPPKVISKDMVESVIHEDGTVRKRIRLTFDTPHKASFEIALWFPVKRGKYPLLLTQPRDYQIPWAEEALRRGYLVCLYPGLDAHHSEKDYPDYQNVWKVFQDEYPEASWSSSLAIQAWLAGRTLDYLLEPENGYLIDRNAIGIIGHSRYGKQSLYAAAFDERIRCVVARSSGTPTACSYRFASRQTFMESVHDFPEAWARKSLKDFYGRENELPIEGNSLLALIAPRHLMLHTAYQDGSDPTFGVERSYVNAKKAYQFLRAGENICLSYRSGGHNPITTDHVRHNIDYFDYAFKRGQIDPSQFEEKLLHSFDWQDWKRKQSKEDLLIDHHLSITEKIRWMLGRKPSNIVNQGKYHIRSEKELGIENWSRDRWNPGGLQRIPFCFGAGMQGNIYFHPGIRKHKGTVIWLHPWNYSHGSNEGYGVEGTAIYWRLAQEGYIVAGYDQFGFGEHLLDAVDFYQRYPNWSKLGRAVYDVECLLDFLLEGKGIANGPIPKTDPAKIYVLGFSYGGMVALYSAALDPRIAGVAAFSGFTPMRTDTDEKPTGGLKPYYQWHPILPKLGLYKGREKDLPYDYEDLIRRIAPRKCLIYSPSRDRFADSVDIKICIDKAKAAWKNPDGFTFLSPDDVCRFQKDQQDVVVRWLETAKSE